MKNSKIKECPTEGVHNTDLKGVNVTITTKKEEINGVVLRGHGVLNAEKGQFNFYQDFGVRKKNPILSRTNHITFRTNKDGQVRATIVYEPAEQKTIKDELITEIRENFKKMEGKK